MNIKPIITLIVSICFGSPLTAIAGDVGGGGRLVLNLVGTGTMYESTVPDIDGDGVEDPAVCFDVDLVDGKNRQIIGTATDCLSDIVPFGDGVSLVGTSFFHLSKGTLITRGNTTVKPVVSSSVTTPAGNPITHETAAAATGNSILDGTRRFAGATGTVRLSGMVNLSEFPDEAFFDCLFIVDLD